MQVQTFSSGGTSIRLTNYTYVQGGNGVTMTAGSSNAIAKTVYTDALGNAVLTVLGDGSHSSNGFDLAGNLVSATDALGNTTSYSYNALNQRVSQTLPDGTVTSFSYDAAGDLLTRGMAAGTLDLVRSYDNAGRELSEQLSAGSGSTRQFSYAYYPAGNAWAGKLQSITGPTTVSSYAYDGFLRVQALTTTGAQSAANTSTTYSYDNRGLMTSASQSSTANAAGPPTQVSRTFDGYGRILTEAVSQNGTGTANITQTWDGAGRRASLNEASSSLAAPLFSYQHQADGNLVSVASAGQTYSFTYGDNGLMTERSNPYRILTVGSWDAAGQILQEVNTVSGSPVLVENLTWRANGTLSSYGAIRTGTGSWNETRNYAYNARGQLVSEGASSTASNAVTFAYTFDGNNPGMGVRTAAQELSGTLMSWQDTAAATNGFSQVTSDQLTSAPSVVPASGVALGADHVNVAVDGISQGQATFAGTNDPVGAWSINLTLAPGSHTLTASAVHPSGLYTATSSSTFTVQGTASGTSTNVFDGNGNMTSRTWTNGQVQTLTWDAFNRLIAVTLRDASNNGYNWSAIYDPLGRRLQTTQQTVTGGSPTGSPNVISSIYDPQVEFLEIGVSVNGAKAWNVYGPDLDLSYGSLQGTGGLEAIVTDAGGATVGVLSDRFGNAVATSTGSAVSWGSVPVAGYGPLPGFAPISPTSLSQLPQASVWRGRRIDPTGFYYLGARYYEPTSGRFLSADPMGQASSPSLYDFAGGDPVNRFDPDGRCPGNSKPFYGDSIPGPWGSFFQGLEEGAYSDAMAFRALPEGLGTMAGYAYQDPYGTYLGVGAYLDNTFVQGYWLAASSSFGDIPRDFSSAWDLYLNDPNSRQAVTNALAGAGTLIGLGGVQGAFSPAGNSAFNVTTDATATSPLPGSPDFIGPMPAAETTSIATPYAVEAQSASAEAQAALAQAQNGATLYRTGELGTSMAGESQYWSLQNPLSPGYANGVGMPGVQPNFIMTGTLNPGATVITNEAAGLGANAGGQIQVIVQPGGVGNLGFHMP